VGARKAENAAEVAHVDNHENYISSEHLMGGSPKERWSAIRLIV
jgi:hypothetical protein